MPHLVRSSSSGTSILTVEGLRYLLGQPSIILEALLLGSIPRRVPLILLNRRAVSLFILKWNVTLFVLRELLFDLFDRGFGLAFVGMVLRLLSFCGLLLIL